MRTGVFKRLTGISNPMVTRMKKKNQKMIIDFDWTNIKIILLRKT